MISVVVVTYNSRRALTEYVVPLYRQSDESVEFIVVDNASSDGTDLLVVDQMPSATLVRNMVNGGFAQGVNLGLAASRGSAVVLLNPDCALSFEALRRGADRLEANPTVGILAPLISHPQGRLEVVDAGLAPTLRHLACHYLGLSRSFESSAWARGLYLRRGQLTSPRQNVEWVSGACMFISSAAIDQLGPLTERWFMYAEDVEYCLRAIDHGFTVELDTTLSATHEIGGSSETTEVSSAWLLNLYDLYLLKLCPTRCHALAWKFVAAIGMFTRSVVYALRAVSSTSTYDWATESRRFRIHGFRILRAPLKPIE